MKMKRRTCQTCEHKIVLREVVFSYLISHCGLLCYSDVLDARVIHRFLMMPPEEGWKTTIIYVATLIILQKRWIVED